MKNERKNKVIAHPITAIFLVFFEIAVFIGGYNIAWRFMEKPLNDGQFAIAEQIARDVYAQTQKGNVIVEAPDDFSISMTTTTITVQSSSRLSRGKVIAKLQNNKIVTSRDLENTKAIGESTAMGILSALVTIIIIVCVWNYKKGTFVNQ